MKPPFSYYGGKQNMLRHIIPLIPEHNLYCAVEVINDTNKELVNFYETVQREFPLLESEIRISLHSRTLHRDASVIYDSPHLFTRVQRAWAVWILANQSFSSMLDGSWGYDKKKNTTSKKINNKREGFTEEFAIRLQNVQVECTDAIRIIRSRDTKDTFHYVDPPYFNSDCGHYDGYTIEDFEMLLKQLERVEGKFMLSSYPSPILKEFVERNGWHQKSFEQTVSVNKGSGGKKKIEVVTANYVLA
jgi:DNA adenine methylase